MSNDLRPTRLAIVVPCFNEEETLPGSDRRLRTLLARGESAGILDPDSFILYVDDGSRDRTWEIIGDLHNRYANVRGISLAANSGHQAALMAGMAEALTDADAVVTIDADLQDSPDAILEMVALFRDGAEIVYGVRRCRDSDTWFKRTSAQAFYKIQNALGAKTVYNHADFRLMSRRACTDLLDFGERNLFLRGIVPTLGYRQEKVYYDRTPRLAGETKYPLGKMIAFAATGITAFSIKPVRMVFFAGVIFLIVAAATLGFVLVQHWRGNTITGWSSLMVSIWFCSGAVLMALGIIGEYIGKIYTEVKHRPRFHIRGKL